MAQDEVKPIELSEEELEALDPVVLDVQDEVEEEDKA